MQTSRGKQPNNMDEYLNNLRGRKLRPAEVDKLLAIAITVNRYATQRWYKKIRRLWR